MKRTLIVMFSSTLLVSLVGCSGKKVNDAEREKYLSVFAKAPGGYGLAFTGPKSAITLGLKKVTVEQSAKVDECATLLAEDSDFVSEQQGYHFRPDTNRKLATDAELKSCAEIYQELTK